MKKVMILLMTLLNINTVFAVVVAPKTTASIKNKSHLLKAAFEQTWERYPSPDVVISQLLASFPLVESQYIDTNCTSLQNANRLILGDNNVTTGAPLVNKPNSGFIVWYVGCVQKMLKAEANSLYSKWTTDKQMEIMSYLGLSAIEDCIQRQKIDKEFLKKNNVLSQCQWKDFSEESKKQKIKEQIIYLLGPEEVIVDLGIASSLEELTEKILRELTDYNSKIDSRYKFLDITGETNLVQTTQIVKFLLMMLDIIKY